jgi:hypothetical protein
MWYQRKIQQGFISFLHKFAPLLLVGIIFIWFLVDTISYKSWVPLKTILKEPAWIGEIWKVIWFFFWLKAPVCLVQHCPCCGPGTQKILNTILFTWVGPRASIYLHCGCWKDPWTSSLSIQSLFLCLSILIGGHLDCWLLQTILYWASLYDF